MTGPSLGRVLAAEALGSALLVATVVGSGIMAQRLSGGNDAVALLANAFATGAMLVVLIDLFGPISGAHFNPAVTAVFVFRRAVPAGRFPAIVLVQIAGGIAGTMLAHAMFDLPLIDPGTRARHGWNQWLAESVATFGLVLTILGTLRHRPERVAVAVALYITAAYWFTASTSFANPAVTIARAFTTSFAGIAPDDVAGFVVAQLAGAAVGARVSRALFECNTKP